VTLAFSYLNRFTVAPLDYGTRGGAAVAVMVDLLASVRQTLQPEHSSLWVRAETER
jgi:hypothetical protein